MAGDEEATKHLTEQALELSQKATEVHPELAEAFYHHAKFAALLRDSETAVNSLGTAIQADRNYCIKADADRDFDSVSEDVSKLFESLRQQVKQEATETIETVKKLPNDWVYQSAEAKQTEGEIRKALEQAESFYSDKDTYFDSLDVLSSLKEAKETFDQIPPFSFEEIDTLSSKSSPVFSPDGGYLAIKSSDDTWKIYQTDGFKEIDKQVLEMSVNFSVIHDGVANFQFAFVQRTRRRLKACYSKSVNSFLKNAYHL